MSHVYLNENVKRQICQRTEHLDGMSWSNRVLHVLDELHKLEAVYPIEFWTVTPATGKIDYDGDTFIMVRARIGDRRVFPDAS